ncbi:ABC transporter ATP-binding protein [Streptomyces sp. NPDC006355]|uniref:ABC transporter ATP-binding protein n=1 Tax=Streptomyces sp. NPDC006355 TaxID=3156758 RepID=UPI0033BB2B0A
MRTTASEELLFGGQLVYDNGWVAREEQRHSLDLKSLIVALPRLLGLAISLAWQADRKATLVIGIAQVVRGVSQALLLLGINFALARLLAPGAITERLHSALPTVVLICLASAMAALADALSTRFASPLQPKVERTAREMYLERASRVEMAAMEDENFHRMLESAKYGAASAARMIDHSVATISALTSLIAAGGVLTVLHPILLPMLLIIVLPRAWATLTIARMRYRSFHQWVQHVRAAYVLSDLLTATDAAGEIRVHKVGPFLLEHFRRMAEAEEAEQTRLARLAARITVVASAMSGLFALCAYMLLAALLWNEVMPLATAGAAVMAIRAGSSALDILVMHLNYVNEESMHVSDLVRLVDESKEREIPLGGKPLPEDIESIRLENVTFGYPGTDSGAVLHDISLTIPRGKVVALVGENGSGKSTLVKLISGLYVPQLGHIWWNDVDAADADRQEIFSRFAIVSQDQVRWPMTARVNVGISYTEEPVSSRRLESAAAQAGVGFIADLPKDWSTLLARGFKGGHQLSGGQWQRLGIARAHYRSAEILVVDEPTAALDPKAERETFKQIRALAATGQTIILITHRMASVRHADIVYVLREGQIVESGTPAALLCNPRGEFRALHDIQAAQFIDRSHVGVGFDVTDLKCDLSGSLGDVGSDSGDCGSPRRG